MPSLLLSRLRQGNRTLRFLRPIRFCLSDFAAFRRLTIQNVRRIALVAQMLARPTRSTRSKVSGSIWAAVYSARNVPAHVRKGRSNSLGNIDLQPASATISS